jgi:hypothetical protein
MPVARPRRQQRFFVAALFASAAFAHFGPELAGVRAVASLLVAPVAVPAHAMAGVAGRMFDDVPTDLASPDEPRDESTVYAENVALRQQVERLAAALQTIGNVARDRAALGGDLLPHCRPARVIGLTNDSGGEMLQIAGAGEPGQRVLFALDGNVGLVGTVEAAAGGIASVRLLSDPQHRPTTADFVDYEADQEDANSTAVVVTGSGDGTMTVARFRTRDVADREIGPGTAAVCVDADWPELLRGLRVGLVAEVEETPNAVGFSRLTIVPATDLRALREVLVYVGPPTGG